jgi:multidrug efflux pump subunit AcrB
MSLTRLAFRFRPVVLLLTALLLAQGLYALLVSLPRREDPDLQGRWAQVVAVYPGATAAQVEMLVTDRLERTLREVDDIKTVSSDSRPGLAILQIESADHMTGSLQKMMDDIRERVADARPTLPEGVTAVQVNDRFADTSALILGVTRPGATASELERSAKRVRDRLRALPEVGEVRLLGARQEIITVALSSARLAALNGATSPERIAAAIARRNVLPNAAGSVPSGDARLTISPTGEFASAEQIGSIVVGAGGSGPVYLRDVATVTRGYADPPASLVRVDGEPGAAVSVTMRKGRNITDMGRRARVVLREAGASLPLGTRVTVVNDLPRSVERRVGGFFHELRLAVFIILGVMFLFMGWRSALLVGAMLPVSMLATFALMEAAGREVHQMSIAALIIALALVVDNSIVVLDNIEERLADGLPSEEAALRGSDELARPMLTANLVTCLSFLPLAFMPGAARDFTCDLGFVTSISLLISVALNLTVMPLLCARFLRPTRHEKKTFVQRWLDGMVDGLREGKATLARWASLRPGLVAGAAALGVLGAAGLIPRLGLAFFPAAERDQFIVDVWLPEGSDITATERTATRVERIIRERGGPASVRSLVTYIGQGGPRFYYNVTPEPPAANYAQIVVNTTTVSDTDRLVAAVQREADATITGARITARKLEQGPPIGAPIAVRLYGEDKDELRRLASGIGKLIARTPGAHSVSNSFGETTHSVKLAVRVDEERAALFGLSSAEVAQTARLAFSGQTVSVLREADEEIPIALRLDPAERRMPGDLSGLYLAAAAGSIPLSQVATLALAPEEARVTRRNGERAITVQAYANGTRLASAVVDDVTARLAALPLPPGYRLEIAGEAAEASKTFGDMALVFGLAFGMTVVLLVLQFNSWPVVLAILSAVPLGVIGAAPGLYLTGQNFGFMAFLGISALGGIVTNHSIFLFHYAQEEQRAREVSMAEALVNASRRRLRPILLTVLLSVGALLPQALSGSRLWPPLDWAIIAGLSVSMFLSMIVIPAIYTLLARRREDSTGDY